MKISMDCVDFKKAVEKAIALTVKNGVLPFVSSIKIDAHKDATGKYGVDICATDSESFLKVRVDAAVIEPGSVFIHVSDVKKVYSMSGNVTISGEDGKFTVSNGRKKSTVPSYDYSSGYPEFPGESGAPFMNISENCLYNTLGALISFSSCNDANKTMCSYYFDGKHERIVTCDSYRLGFRNLPETFVDNEAGAILPNKIYSHLKKILNAKSDGNVSVRLTKQYAIFCGEDFTYCIRSLEGNYLNIDSFVDNVLKGIDKFEFELDAEELGKLSKEYKKDTGKEPMLLTYDEANGELLAGVMVTNYYTADVIESFGAENYRSNDLGFNFTYGLNPQYVADAMNVFDGEIKCAGLVPMNKYHGDCSNCMKSAIAFYNDEYTTLVLPVNVSNTTVEKFTNYIKAA